MLRFSRLLRTAGRAAGDKPRPARRANQRATSLAHQQTQPQQYQTYQQYYEQQGAPNLKSEFFGSIVSSLAFGTIFCLIFAGIYALAGNRRTTIVYQHPAPAAAPLPPPPIHHHPHDYHNHEPLEEKRLSHEDVQRLIQLDQHRNIPIHDEEISYAPRTTVIE